MDYSYVGSGKIYMREVGAAAGRVEVGNCSKLEFSVSESAIESKDYTKPGGGTYNEVKRIDSVELSMTAAELSPENLARASYGLASAITAATVTNEPLTVYAGAFNPFAFIPAATPVPTVTPAQASATARANTTAYALGAYVTPATANGYYYKATAAGTSGGTVPTYPTTIGATVTDGTVTWTCAGKTTLVAGTDYDIQSGGLTVTSGATIDGETWNVSYTKTAADVVEAMVASGKEYEIFFDGLNEARSGKAVTVAVHRCKLGALKSLGLLGQDYASLELSGKLLKDTTKNGTTVSQYFKVQMAR